MSSVSNDSRKFRIEGSDRMLAALAQAIDLAVQASRATPYGTGAGTIGHGSLTIEVNVTTDTDDLRYLTSSSDDAVRATAGWAAQTRCDECEELVALLFDDAYLETRDGKGVICCECYRRIEDGEEES